MGQHRHHTTRSTPQIPTWPPAHSPLPTGEIRGYNIAYGMLVNQKFGNIQPSEMRRLLYNHLFLKKANFLIHPCAEKLFGDSRGLARHQCREM
jgi:hypothetical protein